MSIRVRFALASLTGFLLGYAASEFSRWMPAPPQPLKVKIVDDGGAHLKVESTVEGR